MTIRLASAALALLVLVACESTAPSGSVEARQPGKRGLYDCSHNASGTQQVIAESPEDAALLCSSPAGGR